MRITKIESQKRNPTRKNVYVDGEFVAGISEEALLRLGLRAGDDITAEQLNTIKAVEEIVRTKEAALHLLSFRARTVSEVQKRLRRKNFAPAHINQVVRELEEVGLLDDGEFARMYVRDRLNVRPMGRRAIRQKLRLHGVEGSIADQALDEVFRTFSQEQAVLDLAKKFLRLHSKRMTDPARLRNRLAGYLARRGFTWDVIKPVLKIVGAQKQEENVDE
jgi:regulatory protein